MHQSTAPFRNFADPAPSSTPLRQAITAAYRRPERECIAGLLPQSTLPSSVAENARAQAEQLVAKLRSQPRKPGIEALVQEYALSTQEGVALMCLAEALLRIPDPETRDALIRDKIAGGNWEQHIGRERSLFANASAWGLALTGKLAGHEAGQDNSRSLSRALTRAIARAGQPLIRRGLDLAMRLMGEHFVMGETIAEALERAPAVEARGFRYSYDMLGEAAMTAADAARYFASYEEAIHAIGRSIAGAPEKSGVERPAPDPVTSPGISIKLSALHPRYSRSQFGRVLTELVHRVKALALLARAYGMGFNIDAEEADRLEISLDVLEALALDEELADWHGLGFVVQAYGRRCPMVIDWLIDLGQRSGHRLMVRLVKGAYWDAEIKRAQVDGLCDYPVFTRKAHTDLSYIACARKLLGAPDAVFPQFATHNAHTLATVYELAKCEGDRTVLHQYEFQCLHGMGEPLYELVVGPANLGRPCRVYAPVGTHETLLPYLVRRLLENGANSSFVNRIADPAVDVADLVADPVVLVQSEPDPGSPHPAIALPASIVAPRLNSAGLDLTDERELARLASLFKANALQSFQAAPPAGLAALPARPVRNPAHPGDVVGTVQEASPAAAREAVERASRAAAEWAAVPVEQRADRLENAAQRMQDRMEDFIPLIVREAGKSVPDAIGEVREAVDFLRYYAAEARTGLADTSLLGTGPLGPIACISPWNFPLAIFTGQVAAALMAGNTVLAKPAEETPLVAGEAVSLLHAAGIPHNVLQLVPGDGKIGAALVGRPETAGVVFTGSTEVAHAIRQQLAGRLTPWGEPVPLIAETGGINAMIVDSSALPEQVVADVIASAFSSAGQRCSALRVLCLQDEIAGQVIEMLQGALAQLRVGPTDRLHNDIGPVISAAARDRIEAYVQSMRNDGCPVYRIPLSAECEGGTFVAPTIIEVASADQITREVFGPVLHVLRFARTDTDRLVAMINAWGYGLTCGIHSRIDETVDELADRINAGNVYVNRNMIGAVVGVQPFGGRGLSGTGPKAGGPLYLPRLVRSPRALLMPGHEQSLPGPVGECNRYRLSAGTRVLVRVQQAGDAEAITQQLASAGLHPVSRFPCDRAVVSGDRDYLLSVQQEIADQPGPLVPIYVCGRDASPLLPFLCEEKVVSKNTAAAGGNASLMTMV